MKKTFYISALAIALTLLAASCDKEPTAPPEPVVDYVTIAQLRDMHTAGATDTIKTNLYIQGVVTLTPELGNVPSMIAYVQDSTAAICLVVDDATNTLAMGSEVKILCNGVIFEEYNGLLQFGANASLTIASNITVINLTAEIKADTVTLPQLLAGDYEGRYVCIRDVQFDAAGTFSATKTLTDCSSEVDVYTRTAASFATQTMPVGNGFLKGVASVYNSNKQILLRDPAELNMTGNRCGEPTVVYLTQDFQTIVKNASVNTMTGWLTYAQAGTKTWFGNVVSDRKWVQATGFGSGETSVITWMMTPALDFTSATSPYIAFECANGYDKGATLKLMVSTDYAGSATPWTSTWDELTFTRPPLNATGWSDFIASGQIDLTAYKGGTTYIAWVYTGSSTQSTTWEIDNVLVGEK